MFPGCVFVSRGSHDLGTHSNLISMWGFTARSLRQEERFDVVVAELLDAGGLGEKIVPFLRHAKSRRGLGPGRGPRRGAGKWEEFNHFQCGSVGSSAVDFI